MEFIKWHYKEGIGIFLSKWANIVESTLAYFSFPVLVKTLFSPWKRLATKRHGAGFSWDDFKYELSFNITSRIVGFFVRFLLILTAAFVIFSLVALGTLGLILYLLMPPLSFPEYTNYKKHLAIFVKDLVIAIYSSSNPIDTIFDNEAGKFVLEHTGLTKDLMLQNASMHVVIDTQKNYSGYADILAHLFEQGCFTQEFWRSASATPEDFLIAAAIWDETRKIESKEKKPQSFGNVKGIGASLLFGYTPVLDSIGKELRLENGPEQLRGREDVVNRIERILESKSNVLLTGQPGVGKNAILIYLAQKMDEDYKRLVEANITKLTKGIVDKNERKNAIQTMLSEAGSAGNVILVIKDLPRITNIEFEGNDFTDAFEEQLGNKKIQIIAITTPDEYEKFLARNTKLMKYFERVTVEPLDLESAMQILIDQSAKLELENSIIIPIPILRKMIAVSNSFSNETPFPKKALELLTSCVTRARQSGHSSITFDDVAIVASEKSGIPVTTLTSSHRQKLANLENIMAEKLIGQEAAIKMIAQSLRARTTGVGSSQKPVGTFLFLGPTGVGKTETARVLSDVYFGNSEIMRFDMAEFIGLEGMTKLIGSMHMNQPGILTTAIRNKPAGMVLFDELEKASTDVFNSLLTLFDEGYIVDAFGRKVDARNTFLISTSNAGSEVVREMVQKRITGEQLQREVLEHILQKRIFSPEFINRFDGVVVYEPLNKDSLTEIAKLKLGNLKSRMLEKNINVEFHKLLPNKVALDGFDPLFGARPMNRVIDMIIGDVISKAMLDGEIGPGDKIILLPGEGEKSYEWEKIG